jgi:hypothetical protein
MLVIPTGYISTSVCGRSHVSQRAQQNDFVANVPYGWSAQEYKIESETRPKALRSAVAAIQDPSRRTSTTRRATSATRSATTSETRANLTNGS